MTQAGDLLSLGPTVAPVKDFLPWRVMKTCQEMGSDRQETRWNSTNRLGIPLPSFIYQWSVTIFHEEDKKVNTTLTKLIPPDPVKNLVSFSISIFIFNFFKKVFCRCAIKIQTRNETQWPVAVAFGPLVIIHEVSFLPLHFYSLAVLMWLLTACCVFIFQSFSKHIWSFHLFSSICMYLILSFLD